MFNADGSQSEMCGNGIRCVAKFVYDHGLVRKPDLTIETGRGVLKLELEIAGGVVKQVRVDMGKPILEPAKIPTTFSEERVVNVSLPIPDDTRCPGWLDACGLDPRITCVSMGNPHAILYCRQVSRVPLEIIGPVLETHEAFPRRTNVHFVEVHSPGEVTMRTWERGSGITLACGTGACSVAVAGVLGGRTQRRLLAHLPGGELQLEWSEIDNHVYMKGPAAEVFSGEWPE
jgi:diaminopimelate epimerase